MTTPSFAGKTLRELWASMTPVTALLWFLALATYGNLALRSMVATNPVDFYILHDGARRLLEGGSVYADPNFLLTPSGLFVVGPFGLLDRHVAFLLWNTLSVLATVAAVACAARFARVGLAGPVPAALLLGLSLSESLTTTLLFGNLNNTLLLALGSAYLLAERSDRRLAAGLLLGVALAVKPVLVLVLLVPLLRRRWQTVGWAVAVPAVLNCTGLALLPHRADFFTVAVPSQLAARTGSNSSLWAVGSTFGWPAWLVVLLRVAFLLAAVAAVWWLRHHPDRVLRLAVSYGLLLLATFLSFSLSQGYYSMLLLPLFASAVSSASPMRNPLTWVATYLFMTLDVWAPPQLPRLSGWFAVGHWTLGWALLFAVLVVWAQREAGGVRVAIPSPRDARAPEDRVLGAKHSGELTGGGKQWGPASVQ